MASSGNKFVFGLTLLLLLFSNLIGYAAYLRFVPLEITQPDGTVIKCFASGDEFYNWVHDEKGYTIVRSKSDGYCYYAVLKNDELLPSENRVGSVSPEAAGLQPWTNISAEKMESYRRDFLNNYMPDKPAIEGFRSPEQVDEFSMINNLVVYIRFSDQTEFAKDTMVFYDMYNNTSEGYNSMQNFFWEASYETLEMPSWFYPVPDGPTVISYQDIFERSYYLPFDINNNLNGYMGWEEKTEREHALLKRACEYIDSEVPLNIDIDNNGDGYIDNMIFTIRGGPSAWSTLLWPHRWVLWNETVFINGKQVWDYNFQIESHLMENGNGVLCHETTHTLGAPDLYHYGGANFVSVGRWDLMDQNSNPPQSMGAYMKYRYCGWIDQIPEITECGEYTLNPITSSENNCFKIASPNSSLEYFVVEYRVKEGTFEGSIPGTGLLVYRIDTRYDGQGNASGPPDEVYIYRPGGTPTGGGTLNFANFSADVERTEINDESDPYPFLQNGQPGGLNISNVGYVGETISFEVTLDKEPVAGFYSSDTLLTKGCSIDFFDDSFCEVDTWEWTFEGGTPASSSDQNPTGIVFEETGAFNVSLKAKNQFGSNTLTMTNFITVSETVLPIVYFTTSDTLVCSGKVIVMNDLSEVCPESWNWEFTPGSGIEFVNGTDASSQNPEVNINEAGIYTVELTVTNANGSSSLTKEDYLTIGGLSAPYVEDFENNAISINSWTVVNNDDFITWEDFFATGNGGFGAAGIDNFDYYKFLERDQLISPPLNLTGLENDSLYFDHAYALKGDILQYSDTLVVKLSDDCGESWTRLLTLVEDGSGNFVTREYTNVRFVPENADDWCGSGYGSECNVIDISQWSGNDNVMIMFESVRIMGNNLYIDNVSVGLSVSVPESGINTDKLLSIYPNPNNGLFEVSIEEEMQSGVVSVYDIRGQLILVEQISTGHDSHIIDLSGNPDGLYFVLISSNGISRTGKVVVR